MSGFKDECMPLLSDEHIPLLSSEWYRVKGREFALCPNCLSVFVDDLPEYGSIRCPRCWRTGYCLIRGLSEEKAFDLRRTKNEQATSD